MSLVMHQDRRICRFASKRSTGSIELKSHPDFEQPSNDSMSLWRYMDLSKFVVLLQTESLYFARADQLGDKYEGSLPRLNTTLVRDIQIAHQKRQSKGRLTDERIAELEAQVSQARMRIRQHVFVSCWHGNPFESAAMWKLYARSGDAVAVRTTYAKLRDQISEEALIGLVRYEDYESHFIRTDSLLAPLMLKRNSFSHENEVRALFWVDDSQRAPKGVRLSSGGLQCPVSLNDLLDGVYVSPDSSPWFLDSVTSLCTKYGLAVKVRQSALSSPALF